MAVVRDWMDYAICRTVGAEAFLPDRGPGRAEMVAQAKAVCHTCTVRRICAENAVKQQFTIGVAAGVDLGFYGQAPTSARLQAHYVRLTAIAEGTAA